MNKKSINFTSPVRAERHGHELQTANRKFQHLQQKSNYTLGEHAYGMQCGPAHQQGRSQQGHLIWTGAGSYVKCRKNILISLAGSSPDSSGTGPVRLEKCQLIGTKLKLKKHENIVGQPLKQFVCNKSNLSGNGPAHLKKYKIER